MHYTLKIAKNGEVDDEWRAIHLKLRQKQSETSDVRPSWEFNKKGVNHPTKVESPDNSTSKFRGEKQRIFPRYMTRL